MTYKRRVTGKNSVGRDEFLEYTKSIWRFPAASARKANHPAPFPVELPLRLIHLYSFVGDIVLDPFMGSGTTAEAAVNTDRRYVGYEINPAYVEHAKARVAGTQLLVSAHPSIPHQSDISASQDERGNGDCRQ